MPEDKQACENLVKSVYHLDKFTFHPVVVAPLEAMTLENTP